MLFISHSSAHYISIFLAYLRKGSCIRTVISIVLWSHFCLSIYLFACIICLYMHTTMSGTLPLPSEQLTHWKDITQFLWSSCSPYHKSVNLSWENWTPLWGPRQWHVIPLGFCNLKCVYSCNEKMSISGIFKIYNVTLKWY